MICRYDMLRRYPSVFLQMTGRSLRDTESAPAVPTTQEVAV